MTRQQYRQLQRKRIDLQLPEWSTFFPVYKDRVLKVISPEELIARRAAMLLGKQEGVPTEFDLNRPGWMRGASPFARARRSRVVHFPKDFPKPYDRDKRDNFNHDARAFPPLPGIDPAVLKDSPSSPGQ